MITPSELRSLLAGGRFDLSREALTQADIETWLAARLPLGCLLEREVRLGPRDRPDFMVDGRLAIEVKIKHQQRRAIWRQVERYVAHDRVEAVVLASNVAMGGDTVLNGKPVLVLGLGAAWL
ncbi:MAG: hypothetical protein GC145_06150 [Caulobacter sp.]|nr:hypothetical protein [Caulobacter sp.]